MRYEAIIDEINDADNLYFKGKVLERKRQTAIEKERKEIEKKEIEKNIKKHKEKESKFDLSDIKSISGIFEDDIDMKSYVDNLIPGSFGIRHEFIIKSPYFSRDNDELYIVQNPVLKEYTTKIPMIRGSGWKGYLSSAALKKLREKAEDDNYSISDMLKIYFSYTRVFGTGSENFRKMKETIETSIAKNKDNKKDTEALIKYCLYDLGINIKISKNGTSIVEQLTTQIFEEKEKAKDIFSINKGRGIFYPTYFDNINYEVINPHDREKRAGINPIFYEVVPSGSKGFFQFIYIPFNGILKDKKELDEEIETDKKFVEEILEYCLNNMGIGAKTKLGWGLGEILKPIEPFDSKTEA